MEKIVIIGGGASSLFCTLNLSDRYDITILDGNSILGKKILVTGNGRCNFWNKDMSNNHYESDSNLLDDMLIDDLKEKTFSIFTRLGLSYKTRNNYYYPYSDKALTIKNMLVREINNKAKIKLNYMVNKIEYKNQKYIINDEIYADRLIMATGGLNNEIQSLLEPFNFKVVKTSGSLAPIITDGNYLNKWDGIRTDVKASLYIDGNLIKEENGEIQLTSKGISGICIFNLSGLVSHNLNSKPINIKIDFLPFLKTSTIDFLNRRKDLSIKDELNLTLNETLVDLILDLSGIDYSKTITDLSKKELSKLESHLREFSVNPIGIEDKKAQVTRGGISLEEINIQKFETLKYPKMYLIGEILDVDGECGGYNLGFAWMSAYQCARSINND
ncbi:MAG TPA: aminoacetone oxidase family FAD-binding enzyme [Bacilli bacterium]|nr:aminoacetone oxidase family FAD-binding enzyme [Bacilli bacterium]HQC83734.1 aminoacetone oxidase family FAD-binding enzyme [Bacilli bacterium]